MGETTAKGVANVATVAAGVTGVAAGKALLEGKSIPAALGEIRGDTRKGIQGADPFGNKAAEKKRQSAAEKLAETPITSESTTDTTTTQDLRTTGTSQTFFDPKSAQEQELEAASIESFNRARGLATDIEGDIAARGALQAQGRGVLGDIASGAAFEATGAEQGRIDAIRQAELDIGQQQVGGILTERLAQLEADAQRRGLRGQAFTQLQGDVLGEAAQSVERRTLEANRAAAQGLREDVKGRVGLQAGVGQGLATFQTDLQQQALANQQGLQDPAALRALRQERLAGGRTETTGTTTGTTQVQGTTSGVQTGVNAAAAAQLANQPSAAQQNLADALAIGGTVAKGAAAAQGAG